MAVVTEDGRLEEELWVAVVTDRRRNRGWQL